MSDKTLKKLAIELTAKLRAEHDGRLAGAGQRPRQMRLLIKRLLRKYKYPPEGQEDAITMVLKQAEALASVWSSGGVG